MDVVGIRSRVRTQMRRLKVEEIASFVWAVGQAIYVVGDRRGKGRTAGGGRAPQFNENSRTRHIWRATATLSSLCQNRL
ncbi:hypothetical protein X777_08693 [Ooceraea biroi]|uniref:Uncharacterized protein n=1 Tax=Ooceraea biroi TaxID=2015173 RepID=A0A026W7Z4_OOCBI|nr:hypothetical protein X777_08693 [Ooceraea biroi]